MKDHDFTVITVALDQNSEDPRPYIEKAAPTHPSLIDSEHRVADLYGIINISTAVWIDRMKIVRPNAIEYGSDLFKQFHGIESEPHLNAVRAWAKEGIVEDADPDSIRSRRMPPTADEQMARAEFAVAWNLSKTGRSEAAEPHYVRAGELSPHDWTIRRGSMPIRGQNPMGPEFFELAKEWDSAGKPGYASEAAKRQL